MVEKTGFELITDKPCAGPAVPVADGLSVAWRGH